MAKFIRNLFKRDREILALTNDFNNICTLHSRAMYSTFTFTAFPTISIYLKFFAIFYISFSVKYVVPLVQPAFSFYTPTLSLCAPSSREK